MDQLIRNSGIIINFIIVLIDLVRLFVEFGRKSSKKEIFMEIIPTAILYGFLFIGVTLMIKDFVITIQEHYNFVKKPILGTVVTVLGFQIGYWFGKRKFAKHKTDPEISKPLSIMAHYCLFLFYGFLGLFIATMATIFILD